MGVVSNIAEVSVWRSRELKRKQARDSDKHLIQSLQAELASWKSWYAGHCAATTTQNLLHQLSAGTAKPTVGTFTQPSPVDVALLQAVDASCQTEPLQVDSSPPSLAEQLLRSQVSSLKLELSAKASELSHVQAGVIEIQKAHQELYQRMNGTCDLVENLQAKLASSDDQIASRDRLIVQLRAKLSAARVSHKTASFADSFVQTVSWQMTPTCEQAAQCSLDGSSAGFDATWSDAGSMTACLGPSFLSAADISAVRCASRFHCKFLAAPCHPASLSSLSDLDVTDMGDDFLNDMPETLDDGEIFMPGSFVHISADPIFSGCKGHVVGFTLHEKYVILLPRNGGCAHVLRESVQLVVGAPATSPAIMERIAQERRCSNFYVP